MLSLTTSALTWTDLILVCFFLKLIPKNITLIPYEADTFQHELLTLLQPLLVFYRLDSCSLTGKACEDISSALGINQTLTDLYLTNNALGNTGVRLLCERLSHPGCKLRVLWWEMVPASGGDGTQGLRSGVSVLSRVRLFVTSWTIARQAPLSVGFSRQEYWSGLPFASPGDLPNPD